MRAPGAAGRPHMSALGASVSDSGGDALSKTVNGLWKADMIHGAGPSRLLDGMKPLL